MQDGQDMCIYETDIGIRLENEGRKKGRKVERGKIGSNQ